MKYFNSKTRGEQHELKEQLQSDSKDRQKSAIKQIIASMTVGRDVSSLFSDVTRLIGTVQVDIKKLVYLYIMSTAKSQPEKAVLLAGSFVRDCGHESPLVRGLAIRTMSAVNVEKMGEYLADPLKTALKDVDPYVRKTAALAVTKLYTINKNKAEDGEFIDILGTLLTDSIPAVVSNAVAALVEIRQMCAANGGVPGAKANNDLDNFRPQTVHTLLNALNEASEWGQAFILEGLATYTPTTLDEAEMISERILPRLQHANAAVVLSTIRIIVRFLETWARKSTDADISKKYCAKIAPSLVSLVSGGFEPEIRYVALRNVTLIIQRYPDLLTNQIKVFFAKYNEPIFIKLEKLEIMLHLVTPTTVDICLSEFQEYAQEVDVEFVRKSVRAIGRTAIKIDTAAQKCIDVLLSLVSTRVNYVVQEATIVIKDIFRKYPNQYESIIASLCENLDTLDEAEAKAAMIWIIGEYAERIENADELLDMFLETFEEETTRVKLASLTATVKLFLKRPSNTQELLQTVLKMSSESDIPDLRDRGYMYWRLLSADPEAAKTVVLAKKDPISQEVSQDHKNLLDELMQHIGTLGSVYQRPPNTFVAGYVSQARVVYIEDQEDEADEEAEAEAEAEAEPGEQPKTSNDASWDWMGFDEPAAPAAATPAAPAAPAAPQPPVLTLVLSAASAHGVSLEVAYSSKGGKVVATVCLRNEGPVPRSGFVFQINKNVWGLKPVGKLEVPEPLQPGGMHQAELVLCQDNTPANTTNLQLALKSNGGLAFGDSALPAEIASTLTRKM